MGSDGRPIPADLAMANYGPNAFMADGMGGAEYRPPMAMAPAGPYQPPAMGQPAAAMGYYPATGYYPPAMMPAGVAVASDMAQSAPWLATLRQSVLPSERERAADALARCDWKADPQVVPALVMAATSDPAPMVRCSCVRALGQMKANTMPAVEAVRSLKSDKDVRVRQQAEQVLPVLMKQ
jgi:hypothetical protein